MPEWSELKRTCAEALDADGQFLTDWTRKAFEAVPREAFVPDRFWWPEKQDDGLFPLIDRKDDPERWAEAVYASHTALITQIDEGAVKPEGPANGHFTSSVSAPNVVVRKLGHLDLSPGQRVLEIGTGSGYNAALLAERTARVTTVEVDQALATAAREALTGVRSVVEVVWGDGARGRASSAPFDRIIATASVRKVPLSWVEQTAPGGALLVPMANATEANGLLLLRVEDPGRASGRFVDTVAFMPLRGQEDGSTGISALYERTHQQASGTIRECALHELTQSWDAELAVSLRLSDVWVRRNAEGTWWISNRHTTSWAAARKRPDGSYRVKHWGPRDLFAEVAGALEWWRSNGRPKLTDFGVTVTAERGQQVWLIEPDNVIC
ncbi:rRNA adenine N-6-methyltransferase family protein [Streptomyces chrestomyceticus]|uniref:rRNA adenine N-6-methyltransferase family protein n=1 Tax=Streptomyces chrestomyceticus TaxID=68185 RepID=UPI0036AC18DD